MHAPSQKYVHGYSYIGPFEFQAHSDLLAITHAFEKGIHLVWILWSMSVILNIVKSSEKFAIHWNQWECANPTGFSLRPDTNHLAWPVQYISFFVCLFICLFVFHQYLII